MAQKYKVNIFDLKQVLCEASTKVTDIRKYFFEDAWTLEAGGHLEQGIIRGRNCRLSTETPNYQLGWAILAASRLLDTLKRNFHFM